MSDPTLPGTPGTGPIPEPEPEGFRDEQTEAEKQRLLDEKEASLQRSKDAKDFYSDAPPEPPPVEGETRGTKGKTKGKSDDEPTTTGYTTKH